MKRRNQRLLSLLLLLLLASGCTPIASQASPPADRAVVLPGVRLEAPADDRWTVAERDAERVVLSRATSEGTATLSVRVLPANPAGDGEAFVRTAEAEREAEVKAFEMQSEHYNATALAGATCLYYDGIYRDPKADPARPFHTRKGYVCRHPSLNTKAVWMEISLDSGSRNPPEAEALLRVADAFFQSAVFTR